MKISSYFSLLGQYVVARRRVAGSGSYTSPQQCPTMGTMMETALSQAWSAPAAVPVAHRDRPGNLRMLRRLHCTR